MYFKDMILSTKEHLLRILTDYLFYFGGLILGGVYYLTGLSVEDLQKVLIIIFIDMGTRIWAEKANKRNILSRKMWYGFFGKLTSYMTLFAVANHAFYVGDILDYIIFGGFSLIEARSVYENLREAKQGHLDIIGERLEGEFNKFRKNNKNNQEENQNKKG